MGGLKKENLGAARGIALLEDALMLAIIGVGATLARIDLLTLGEIIAFYNSAKVGDFIPAHQPPVFTPNTKLETRK